MVWKGLGKIGEGAGGAGLDVTSSYAGDKATEGGAEIADGKVFSGEEIGEFASEFIGGVSLGVFAGVVVAEAGMAERGARHWRPSAKVKRHKDLRSLALREDIKVSLELSFGIADWKEDRRKPVPPTRKHADKNAGPTS